MYIGDIYVSPKNHALVGVEFAFVALAAVFVILRLFTRLWLVRSVGFDDAFIVVSVFGTVGFLVGVLEQIRYGLGDAPDPATLTPFIKASTASVISYTICHLTVKLSIVILYLRIFITAVARRLFICILVFQVVYGILCLCLTIMVCLPVAKYWDDSIPGHCLDNRAMRYAFAGINIVNDVSLLIAPMPFLRHLQIPKRVKIVLMAVFAAGGAACIIAIIRLYSLWAYSSVPTKDRPVKGIDIAMYSGLECNMAIICACVPSLKPLARHLFPGLMSTLHSGRSGPSGNPSDGRNDNHSNGSYRAAGGRTTYSQLARATAQDNAAGNDASADTKEPGIQVQQSFEMKAVSGTSSTAGLSNDSDSEKNLVHNSAVYRTQLYGSEKPNKNKTGYAHAHESYMNPTGYRGQNN